MSYLGRKSIFSNPHHYCVLLFAEMYSQCLLELNRSYNLSLPNENVMSRQFKGIRWKSARLKNFLTIMKVLSEKGKCTVSDIVENDGYSERKKDKRNRNKIYSKIIEGLPEENIDGLRKKTIVQIAGTVMTSKPTKQYELSHFGVFYAIHLFAKGEKKRNFLDIIASNYKHLLPLIFGKWEIIKKEFGENLEILIEFADEMDPLLRVIRLDNPLLNVSQLSDKPIFITPVSGIPQPKMVLAKPSYFTEEITLWFLTVQLDLLGFNKWKRGIMKDEEIHSWYYHYITKLLERERENLREVRYVKELITKKKRTRS